MTSVIRAVRADADPVIEYIGTDLEPGACLPTGDRKYPAVRFPVQPGPESRVHPATRLEYGVSCDIVIRSYYRDFRWLRYCLASIDRYCHGFRNVVVVIPQTSLAKWRWLGLRADRVVCCPAYRDDYLGQQVTKLFADIYSDADYVCHVDSDCVFQRSTTPGDLADAGRPHVLMEPYARLDSHAPWQALTERFLGAEISYEFMRRPPYTYPRWLYPALRKWCQARHGVSLDEYVLSRPPRGFSEFNALGAYAYRHHRDSFAWLDVTDGAVPPGACRVFWSHRGLDAAVYQEICGLLNVADGGGNDVRPPGAQ